MLEPAIDGNALPRAFLRVGGMAVAQQQLALALALNCERVVCLAQAMRPELITMQHAAEAAGAKFHLVAEPRALLGLVTATDELVVLADGLFTSIPQATALLDEGSCVLVQPAEAGVAAGFERIDINHAAAGAMRLPGRLVERIADLPGEYDAVSALQRIALQAGVRQRPVPVAESGPMAWTIVHSDAQAQALEPLWIAQRIRDDGPIGPSRVMARVAVMRLGAALLHAGSGAIHVAIGAVLIALIGLGVGWLGLVPVGLCLCGIGWFLRQCAVLLARIEGKSARSGRALRSDMVYGLLLDVALVTLAGWGTTPEQWQPAADRFFPPFMVVALLRIVARTTPARWAGWMEDRTLLALGFAAAIGFGAGREVIHAAAVLIALGGIALSSLSTRLTRP